MRQLYQAGVNFQIDEAADGAVIFKVISKHNSMNELQQALKQVGTGYIKHSKLEELVSSGIKVVDEGGNIVNKRAMQQLLKSQTVGDAFKNVKAVSKYADSGSGILKIAKVLEGIDIVVTSVTDVYDNVYNPTTGEFLQDFDGRTVVDIVTDVTVDIGAPIAMAKIGGALGSFAGPIGTGIGVAAGALAGLAFTTFKFGEPPQTPAEKTKDIINDATDTVTDWLSVVFW